MDNKEIYIHIGMPKTATTYLQLNFFPNLKDFEYIKKYDSIIGKVFDKILYHHPITYNKNELKKDLDSYINNFKKDKIIISYESLLGNSFNSFMDFEKNIRSIKSFFPKAKIIFTFRRQDKWLESIYKQLLHQVWSITFKQFTDTNIKKNGLPSFNYEILNYNYMYSIIKNEFKDVCFLPFEMFVSNKYTFIERLCFFLKINTNSVDLVLNTYNGTNKGFSLISSKVAFFCNRFLYAPQNSLGFLTLKPIRIFFTNRYNKNYFYKFLARVFNRISFRMFLQKIIDRIVYINYNPMTDSMRKEILEFHNNSNIELDNELKLGLDAYGYYKK